MPVLGGVDPALATVLLLVLNGLVPLPRAAVCIPAGAALGWAALGPAMLGSALGFGLAFFVARLVLKRPVARLAARHARLGLLIRAVEAEGWRLLALLRLGSPVPGPLINLACGATGIGGATFLAVSIVAVLPQTVLFVYLGRTGAQALFGASPLLSLDTLSALAGIVLSLVALWRVAAAAKRQAERIVAETSAAGR